MFLPPAAAWNVDSRLLSRRVLAALVLAGALAGAFFCLNQRFGTNAVVLIVALAVCALGAALACSKPAVGQLRWDAQRWHWTGEHNLAVTRVQCVLDFQRMLLLHIDCESGPGMWLWLYSPTMDGPWRALRRAVVAASQTLRRPASLPE
jgi:ABC-type uncharacterized transport system permease subunit